MIKKTTDTKKKLYDASPMLNSVLTLGHEYIKKKKNISEFIGKS